METVADKFESAYLKECAQDATRGEADDISLQGGTENAAGGEFSPRSIAWYETPMARALWMLYRRPFFKAGAIRFTNTCVQLLPAMLIQRLLR